MTDDDSAQSQIAGTQEEPAPSGSAVAKLRRPRQLNRVDRLVDAVIHRKEDDQTLVFAVRDFVLCGFPLTRQHEQLIHLRRNGCVTLRLQGDPEFGLPFGQDRLVPIWLATAFFASGKPKDGVIRFRAARDIHRAFRLPEGGNHLRRLKDRLQRVYHSSFTVEDTSVHQGGGLKTRKYNLIDGLDLWFHRGAPVNQYTLWQNRIILDPRFADDLRANGCVPIDLESVIALKDSPAALDLYIWQAWRSWRLRRDPRRTTKIPLFGDDGLLAQLGTGIETPFKARQMIRLWHARVLKAWPECPNAIEGDWLSLKAAQAVGNKARIELPGVSPHPPPMREIGERPSRDHLVLVRKAGREEDQ